MLYSYRVSALSAQLTRPSKPQNLQGCASLRICCTSEIDNRTVVARVRLPPPVTPLEKPMSRSRHGHLSRSRWLRIHGAAFQSILLK